jgi:hypothetical protein
MGGLQNLHMYKNENSLAQRAIWLPKDEKQKLKS